MLRRPVCSCEFGRNVVSGAKVDFIRSLAEGCRMGPGRIVLVHPESDQSLHTDTLAGVGSNVLLIAHGKGLWRKRPVAFVSDT